MSEETIAPGLIEFRIMPTEQVEEGEVVEYERHGLSVVGHTCIGSEVGVFMLDGDIGEVLDQVEGCLFDWYTPPPSTWWESPICRVVAAVNVVFEKTYCHDAGVYEYDQWIDFVGLVDLNEVVKVAAAATAVAAAKKGKGAA